MVTQANTQNMGTLNLKVTEMCLLFRWETGQANKCDIRKHNRNYERNPRHNGSLDIFQDTGTECMR